MSPQEQAQLQVNLLLVLREQGDVGFPEARMVTAARMAGHDLALPAIRVELRALADKGWIGEMPQDIGPSRFRITPLGRNILETQRL